MKKQLVSKTIFPLLLIVLLLSLIAGCGGKAQKTTTGQGHMDTPDFHIQRGDQAMLDRQYESARTSFRKALKLDSNHSRALSGMAAATAYAVSKPGVSKNAGQVTIKESEQQIEKALDTAIDRNDRSRAHTYAIQIYLALKLPDDGWYEKAADHFEEAKELTPDDPAPYFFMGRVEVALFHYEKATRLFYKVLDIGGQYEEEADKELKRIQQVQRAIPGSRFGVQIANVEKITRADVAALFIAELRLDRIYKKQAERSAASYKVPKTQQRFNTDPLRKYPEAVDISGHPLETTIKEVIKLEVKGLSPDPAHKFHPDKEFKRAEFAQLIQDILSKITNNATMKTQFIGQPSPFPDVNKNVWYYNAARISISRGLMETGSKATGAFMPMAPVSGADALLAIRSMKEILKAYLR